MKGNYNNISELEKKIAYAYEKQIAQTILDAQKIHGEGYISHNENLCGGYYAEDWETCFIIAARENKLSPNMWYLLHLANHWYNDIQQWAKDTLAGKNVYDQLIKPEDIESEDIEKSKGEQNEKHK